MILDAARHAQHLHAWLTSPDFDQEGEIQRAEAALSRSTGMTPLLAGALGAHSWAGGGRGAPTDAGGLDPVLANATALLDRFCAEGIAILGRPGEGSRPYQACAVQP